jgi:iron-sulfur cluster insertion protein
MPACVSQAPASATRALADPAAARPMPAAADAAASLRISDAVVGKVAEMLAEEADPGLQLRIFVTGGGCAGFQYGFAFDADCAADDFRVECGPIAVVVDAMSLQYLIGAEIDFEDKLDGARFVIRNPNAAGTCGCGSSFSV